MLLRCAACLLLAWIAGGAAEAGECPGNPNALGTSRIIFIDPLEHRRVGKMEYHESLPLRDHEIVLTFDDGPLAPYTARVLDALAAECVRATFFIVGSMAKQAPDLVKRIHEEGHTIGTHTYHHSHMTSLSREAVKKEITDGTTSAARAAGEPKAVAPFFRFPYLEDNRAVDDIALAEGLMIWSVDFAADDWTHISPERVVALSINRLERSHKGIILFHDIQQRTALAMPAFLRELKKRGYQVVQAVPADRGHPKTETKAKE